jgi:uridine phosphorylase
MAKQPHLLVEPGDLHSVALLPGDPGRVDRIAGHCEDAVEVARNREYKVVNARYEGTPVTVCSTGIGCPSATIALEELHEVGVDAVIRVGTTGATQAGVEIGDMVVATGAAKDEGTTRRYESETFPAVPDYGVLSALVEAAEETEERAAGAAEGGGDAAGRVHVGPIASDDAYYAETDEYVREWEAAGILSVEMEAAALFSVARRKGMRSGAICTVDGNLVEGTQKGETDDKELPEKARDNVDRAIGIALDAAVEVAE